MDSYRLTLNATTLDLGSYIRADLPPDFDWGGLFKQTLAQNAYTDGGILSFETNSPRQFKFNLRIASSGAFGGGLDGLEQLVRAMARPGAVIDLQPETVASANSIRFDVIDGRLDPAYAIYQQRLARREETLTLTVQPFGYMPTMILLASTASMGIPGRLLIPIGSMLGDVPGLARLTFNPTVASQFAGTWLPDTLAWSLGGNPSMPVVIPAGSMVGPTGAAPAAAGATLMGNAFARSSQMFTSFLVPSSPNYQQLARVTIPLAVEPAWRGRFRAYGMVQAWPSQSTPYLLSLDAVPDLMAPAAAMGSAQAVATVFTQASVVASQHFQMVDLGEISLPPGGSGMAVQPTLRLWARAATTGAPVATAAISLSELYLLPLDISGAGVLARGLTQPTIGAASSFDGVLVLDSTTGGAVVGLATTNIGSVVPLADARIWYRGVMPRLNGSAQALDVVGGVRASGASGIVAANGAMFASAAVSYRPTFTFLRGM
jgi:hypothetical protein